MKLVALLTLLIASAGWAGTNHTVTTIGELKRIQAENLTGVNFDVKVRVLLPNRPGTRHFYVDDATGSTCVDRKPRDLRSDTTSSMQPGDIINIVGKTRSDISGMARIECSEYTLLSRGKPPIPVVVTGHDIWSGKHLGKLVQVTGFVNDIFRDEISPWWYYIALQSHGDTIYVAIAFMGDFPEINHLVGTQVSVCGYCSPPLFNSRERMGIIVIAHGLDAIKQEQPAKDPFNVPILEDLGTSRPSILPSIGRRKTFGKVIAVWGGNKLLLASKTGSIHRIDLLETQLPSYGDMVEVVGVPETDLYRLNLTRAIWRNLPGHTKKIEPTEHITPEQILVDAEGRPCIKTAYHGRAIRIHGVVRNLPAAGNNDGRMHLECGKFIIPIDISATLDALKNVTVGCEIEVAGTCVNEIPNWSSNATLPRIKEVFLVVRVPTDIVVLKRPPWWTPSRLLMAIGGLVMLLVSILGWNTALRKKSEQRGRELAEERIARAETDMKVLERTRLAVELHDSLAQNLTGVAMEIEAAEQYSNESSQELVRHLSIARRALKSCRDELRNCLWDLRNQALEGADMETMIRRTLLPHMKNVALSLRFNAPRERFTDNTAHVLMCIIRELTINAIRHGNASIIKVAGAIENDHLLFSVKDNGTGFDPQDCPGVEQGHFGLQGMRERILQLNGKLKFDSTIGKGSKATISIPIPKPAD